MSASLSDADMAAIRARWPRKVYASGFTQAPIAARLFFSRPETVLKFLTDREYAKATGAT